MGTSCLRQSQNMDSKILFAFCLTFAFGLAAAFPQVPVPAPKGGGYAPDHYFQYINVPKHKVYEWDTNVETRTTSEKNTSPKRITHSKLSSNGAIHMTDMAKCITITPMDHPTNIMIATMNQCM